MEWVQIQYFQAVAKAEHFTRAAEQLAVSQPALSRSIAKLEEELGVQLFDRRGRNIYLNRYGRIFLEYVEQAIKQMELGKQEIWNEIHPDHGMIHLSFIPSLGMSVVPELLSSYQRVNPHVHFQLNQASNRQIVDLLKDRKVDLALITLLHEDQEIIYQPLLTEELFLIASIDHWLSEYDEIDLSMVRHEPFISFKQVNELRAIINHFCYQAGFEPNIVFEGEDIGTVSGLVGAKLGISLVPDIQVLDKQKIKPIRVKNPICQRDIGMAWLKNSYSSPAVKGFIQFVHHLFEIN
ncbi:LysR family transcriptional regulator [Robertmurraya andreesenii]|uniref:DNA-binding transcriptional LysR family regulator n=1 Tax=Anoxybacillus andreesenii TaxID=1325932 RepID=A0ABT9V5S8_9BACL|nr:LysR family transcriptional regulator [Robertmurraya andreesenii]MDQ0156301.1 DNA-binding transcriptional LysR family regulator [Robertmurraya andreesenii]